MKNKTYAIFGLGRYGFAVAKELSRHGADVIAIDKNMELVTAAAEFLPVCKCADVTDKAVIKQLGISDADVVIVAMAESFEAEIVAISLCKEAGVPTVIAKCRDEIRADILTRVGADQVVLPEVESGVRLAKNLVSSGFVDMVELSDDISIAEIEVKPQWKGKTLVELDLRKKHHLNVIALRKGDFVTVEIDPAEKLSEDMRLVVIADAKNIARMG